MRMKIFERYIFKEHGKLLFLVFFGFSSIYFLGVFLDILDDVIERKTSVIYAIEAAILRIPLGAKELGATAILISVILFMAISSKNREPVVLNSLGVPLTKIMKPFIWHALFLCVLLAVNNNFLAPVLYSKSKEIVEVNIFGKRRRRRFKPTNIWIKHGKYICHVAYFDDEQLRAKNIRCMFQEDHEIKELIIIDNLYWRKGSWWGEGIKLWDIAHKTPKERIIPYGKVNFFVSPDELRERKKEAWEMNSFELFRLVRELKREKIRAYKLSTAFYNRLYLSLTPIIMVLLAFPFGITRERSEGVVFGVVKGLALGFSFWVFYYLFIFLSENGWFPPLFSGAIPLAFSAFLGKKLLKRIE